ncbi:MAG: sulfoxide reductase heme-binding subunit YedZ [Rhodocyclaceae bacterium]|nr:sulfoxide reductase heme-binding subunit YedZ [Rhodocyclaceae bacterium]
MWNPSSRQLALIKVLLFMVCLIPAGWLGYRFLEDDLGANPIEALIRGLGDWGLRFLLITLTVTPARRLFGLHWLLRLRRMLGLFAFFYASLHLSGYLVLDQFFDWAEIGRDIAKRPFITLGMFTFVLLLPLAATSSNAMIRRLGGKRWQALHSLVYAIAVMAVVHYWWMVKLDITHPAIYSLILSVLLGLRLWWRKLDERKKIESAMLKPRPGTRVIPIFPGKR